MTYDELYLKAKNRYDDECATISCIPDTLIDRRYFSVSGRDIFPGTCANYEEMLEWLREFASINGRYKLSTYYCVGNESLAVQYNFDKFTVTFYVRQQAETLEKISQGKCHVEVQRVADKYKVVCGI